MDKNAQAIIKNALINDVIISAAKPEETEEQRRIAALEKRITMLESALAGAQAQVTLNADRFSITSHGKINFQES